MTATARTAGSKGAANYLVQQPSLEVEQERRRRKHDLVAAFRIFGRLGFSEGVAGHITVRDPEHRDRFWVNPYGLNFGVIREEDLLLVTHEGEVVVGKRPVNAAAFAIHSEVHRQRPDVDAAAHAHSIHGKAFATLGIPLEPITQDACAFYEDHNVYTEYGGVANDVEEGRRIGVALGSAKAAILINHGLLTVGTTVAEAAWWFVSMERSCQAQLLAMAAGVPRRIDHATAADVARLIGTPASGQRNFESLRQSPAFSL